MRTTATKEKQLETCLVIATGLLVFYLIYKAKPLLYAAIAMGIIGAFVPTLARWVNWAWYKLADGMGWVMSRVLLTVIFFVFLFPVALLSRLFVKKDSLQLKKKTDTYWTERNHPYSEKDLENVW